MLALYLQIYDYITHRLSIRELLELFPLCSYIVRLLITDISHGTQEALRNRYINIRCFKIYRSGG